MITVRRRHGTCTKCRAKHTVFTAVAEIKCKCGKNVAVFAPNEKPQIQPTITKTKTTTKADKFKRLQNNVRHNIADIMTPESDDGHMSIYIGKDDLEDYREDPQLMHRDSVGYLHIF